MTRKTIFVSLLASVVVLNASMAEVGQDKIVLRQGDPVVGVIEKMDANGNVTIRFDRGTLPFPSANIASIVLVERPEFAQGMAANQAGDHARAVEILKPVVDRFIGIPEGWLAQASAVLAESLASTGNTFAAEQLSERLIEIYRGTPYQLQGTLSKARIALGRGQHDQALQLADEIAESVEASGPVPDAATMSILGDIFMIKGIAQNAKGDKAAAYKSFLTVSTLYYNPKSRADAAQAQAEAIKRDNPSIFVN